MSDETPKSCGTCRFLKDDQTTINDFGAPVCMSRWVLIHGIKENTPEAQEAAFEARAADCTAYSELPRGEDRPISQRPDLIFLRASQEKSALSAATRTGPAAPSCFACKRFIPGTTMADEKGVTTAGACSYLGVAIRNGAVSRMPEMCGTAAEAGARPPMSELLTALNMDPFLLNGVTTIGTESGVRGEVEFVEPTEYETDEPVSDEDKALGIRAWRAVWERGGLVKRGGGRKVLLPVFDPASFPDEERAAIPRTGDDELPEQYIDHQGLTYKAAALWTKLNETPALVGAAGTGKTEFYRYMAWVMCLPFYRISVTASTEIEDLAGKMHYEPSRGTYFEYGRIPKAWMKPGIICLDEPNVGPPDVWQFIRPLTDNSKQLVLDMNNGERVNRHPHAFLGMAMNPSWDVRNSGTTQLADADGSRLMHIFVPMPDEPTEKRIIERRCLSDGFEITEEQLNLLAAIASDIRKQTDADELPVTWGVRSQIKVARALAWFDLATAYRLAAADYLDPDSSQSIMNIVRAHNPAGRGRRADFAPGRTI